MPNFGNEILVYDRTQGFNFESLGYYEPRVGSHLQLYDDFLGVAIDSSKWSSVADTGCTAAAINVQWNGAVRLTTDATDEDRVDMGSAVIWKPSTGDIWFEIALDISNVNGVNVNAGMTDANTYASQTVAFENNASTTYFTRPTSGCGWFYDSDDATPGWRGMGVSANTDAGPTRVQTAPNADGQDILGIKITTVGAASGKADAEFFFNGYFKQRLASACTSTTLLAPYVALKNRSGNGRNLDIDYIKVRQAQVR